MSLPFRPLSFLALFAVWAGVACGEAPAISPRIESVTETGYRAVVSIPEPDRLQLRPKEIGEQTPDGLVRAAGWAGTAGDG